MALICSRRYSIRYGSCTASPSKASFAPSHPRQRTPQRKYCTIRAILKISNSQRSGTRRRNHQRKLSQEQSGLQHPAHRENGPEVFTKQLHLRPFRRCKFSGFGSFWKHAWLEHAIIHKRRNPLSTVCRSPRQRKRGGIHQLQRWQGRYSSLELGAPLR